jgi:hypothetical protein
MLTARGGGWRLAYARRGPHRLRSRSPLALRRAGFWRPRRRRRGCCCRCCCGCGCCRFFGCLNGSFLLGRRLGSFFRSTLLRCLWVGNSEEFLVHFLEPVRMESIVCEKQNYSTDVHFSSASEHLFSDQLTIFVPWEKLVVIHFFVHIDIC